MQLKRGCRGWWIALLAAAADRVTKAAVLREWGQPRLLDATFRPLVPGIINIKLATNRGMAFSLFSGQTLALSLLSALLIAGVLAWLLARPQEPPLLRTGLWLIVGGGLGDLFDRVLHGSVVDFIELDFVRFAVFNIADVCICAGAALAVAGLLMADWKKGRAHGGV